MRMTHLITFLGLASSITEIVPDEWELNLLAGLSPSHFVEEKKYEDFHNYFHDENYFPETDQI